MIYTIDNPKGIDLVARKLQKQLHDKLEWDELNVFGIAEKNFDKKGSPVLESYLGSSEYRDVLLNDDTKGSIFMIDDEDHVSDEGIRFTTDLRVVFILDLGKIFPDQGQRPKREAEIKAIRLLRETHIFGAPTLKAGVQNSLGDFFYRDLLAFDMHPYYTFSVVGKVNYNVSCINN